MASTQARQTARARARAAQQKVIAERKARDEKNMTSMTMFFTAAEQIDTAQRTMARALDDIRAREGTLSAAASMLGLTTGEARKLVTLLDDPSTAPSEDVDTGAATSRASADSERSDSCSTNADADARGDSDAATT